MKANEMHFFSNLCW